MKKYYIENYDSEQLKKIMRIQKILSDSYEELFNKKNVHKFKIEKVKKEKIDEIFNYLDLIYNLTSIMPENKIREIIEKHNGDEEKIILEIEKII